MGTVYVLTNPAWPGYSKIGAAKSPARRLSTYQTGSPLRDYALGHYRFFEDYHLAERLLLERLKGFRVVGTEWHRLHPIDAAAAIDALHKELHDHTPN